MSYGTNVADMFRQVVKSSRAPSRPTFLQVQTNRFEFAINLLTARAYPRCRRD